jgi:hypothetical protein
VDLDEIKHDYQKALRAWHVAWQARVDWHRGHFYPLEDREQTLKDLLGRRTILPIPTTDADREVRSGSVQGPDHQRRQVQLARGAAFTNSVQAASEGPSLRRPRRQRRDGPEVSEAEVAGSGRGSGTPRIEPTIAS